MEESNIERRGTREEMIRQYLEMNLAYDEGVGRSKQCELEKMVVIRHLWTSSCSMVLSESYPVT